MKRLSLRFHPGVGCWRRLLTPSSSARRFTTAASPSTLRACRLDRFWPNGHELAGRKSSAAKRSPGRRSRSSSSTCPNVRRSTSSCGTWPGYMAAPQRRRRRRRAHRVYDRILILPTSTAPRSDGRERSPGWTAPERSSRNGGMERRVPPRPPMQAPRRPTKASAKTPTTWIRRRPTRIRRCSPSRRRPGRKQQPVRSDDNGNAPVFGSPTAGTVLPP